MATSARSPCRPRWRATSRPARRSSTAPSPWGSNMDEREAFAAAEKLVQEAHRRAEEAAHAAAANVPPNGWASPQAPDLGALFGLLETLKGTLPPELARQFADALKQLLIAIRAILDYSIERLERPPRGEPEVEDIPIS